MEAPETSDSCIICDKPNALRCKRCRGASYCSKLCQRGDYPIHKLLCNAFSTFDISKRPTNEHVRAVLFPVDKRQPKLIWLHCEWKHLEEDEDGGRGHQIPDAIPFLHEYPYTANVQYNPVLARSLDNIVCVSYRDGFLIDGSAPNSSIKAIIETRRGYHHDWRGPILAYGRVGPGLDPPECRDIDMNDFHHITDYFVSYASDLVSLPASLPADTPGSRIVKGVRINCIGDEKMFKKPHFEEVQVLTSHSIFSEGESSEIAERIGFPILTQRCFPHPNWANAEDSEMFGRMSPYNNQDATFLHLCIDPKVKGDFSRGVLGWGWAPQQWQQGVGSTIAVRKDQKPLSPWHVEALCRYCRYDARAWIAHSIGEYAPDEPLPKYLVLSMICRPTFSICWYRMLDEKREKGEIVLAEFPYDV
ncbi:hypothetical protein RRF57_010841 [Xylaria bambusicola]|uniref:MYND-type domain-containing protein n=1 Tax=Xylaria bambusicola TaxID=326684 RepID=A0AAN7V214_9PEZI